MVMGEGEGARRADRGPDESPDGIMNVFLNTLQFTRLEQKNDKQTEWA